MSAVSLQFSVFSKPITTDCLLKTLTLLAATGAVAVACSPGESPPAPTPTPEPEAVIEPTHIGPSPSQMEMAVETISTDPDLLQHVVVLKATDSDRFLLIWIGPFEANAIAAEFYNVAATRPQTHDLMGTVIDTLGATIDHVVVSDLRSDTFYARVPTAELYDPASGTFSETTGLANARKGHTATKLTDGRVLIVSGLDNTGKVRLTELYDPSTDAFSERVLIAVGRWQHTATLLPDGRVLVVGGTTDGANPVAAEIYDVSADTFTGVGNPEVRRNHTATRLQDGKVLIVGGSGGSDVLASAELFEPSS